MNLVFLPSGDEKPESIPLLQTSLEIIRQAIMMYVRFPLSLRNVEDLLHERGNDICHETVRYWWNRFGPLFAAEIRKSRMIDPHSYSNWKWHLDEVCVKNNGQTHNLWRAVDHEGEVLESFVTKRRHRNAALVFLKKAMKKYGPPKVGITDRLKSYRAAMNVIGNQAIQEIGRCKNNRAENSHLPFRRRERAMPRFRLGRSLLKSTAIHSCIGNHFNLQRHLTSRDKFKEQRKAAFVEWQPFYAA